MDRLEQENRDLAAEVRALRDELVVSRGAPTAGEHRSRTAVKTAEVNGNLPVPSVEERVAVQEQRIDDLAQTKVEASQRMPVTLAGMVLFNAS